MSQLDEVLTRLPRAPDPQHELAAGAGPTRSWLRALVGLSMLAAAAAVLLLVNRDPQAENTLVRELVNDHLRVLYAAHPLEIESGGVKQVESWFEGKLDFAPRIRVDDDPAWPLQGGSIAYLLDRKAATFVYRRQLHTVTLFVFPERELPWPGDEPQPLGATQPQALQARGLNVLAFRRDDLGYALVSDLDASELAQLAERIAR